MVVLPGGYRARVERALLVALLFAASGATAAGAHPAVTRQPAVTAATQPPNVLLIISDDQAWSTFNRTLMPNVFGRIADQGLLFTRGYDSTSLCCPSRAQIYTGLFEHDTGVDTNRTVLPQPTIVEAAKDAGYRTMLAGKYLNSVPCTQPPAAWDDWYCQGPIRMKDTTMYPGGVPTQVTGYTVDVLANAISGFIQATPADQPFFAVYAPKSPHAPMDDDRYLDTPIQPYRPPNYDEETRTDGKPSMVYRPPLSTAEKGQIDKAYAAMSRAVRGLDTAVGTVLDSLGSRADNTIVFYIDDNGVQYGEHREASKPYQYEENVRVPFAVRYPPLHPTDQPVVTDALVQNTDIAPTVADLLGIPWVSDGVSLTPLIDGTQTTAQDALLEENCRGLHYEALRGDCSDTLRYGGPDVPNLLHIDGFGSTPFASVVEEQWKLIEHDDGERELYDLINDPYELVNRAGDPAVAETEARLDTELHAMEAPPPTDTMIVAGPAAQSTDRIATFRYSARARDATFQCRLTTNGTPGDWYACGAMTEHVGPLADGDYVFEVAGTANGIADPTPASRAFTIQEQGPDATVVSEPPALTNDPTTNFTFSSSDPAVTFDCRIAPPADDRSPWVPCDPTTGFTDTLGDGLWEFQVRADRGSQSTSPPAAALVRVDTTPPAFSTDPTHDTAVPSGSFTMSLTPLEPVAGAVTCAIDAQLPIDCAGGQLPIADLADGAHTVSITSTDLAGNTGTQVVPFTVDTVGPSLLVRHAPPAVTNVVPAFSFSSDDPTSVFMCTVEGGPEFECGARNQMPGFDTDAGPHSLTVKAVDAAGNESAVQSFTWTMTTATPAPPTDVIATAGDGQATVSWTPPSETIDSYEVIASPGGTRAKAGPADTQVTIPRLTDGTAYTFKVVVYTPDGSAVSDPSNPVTPLPVVNLEPASGTEGDTGYTHARVSIVLSEASSADVTVDWEVVAGTAGADDVRLEPGTTVIPAGSRRGLADVAIRGDLAKELTETAAVDVTDVDSATVGIGEGVVTIFDNDPDPTANIKGATVSEGDSGLTDVPVAVTLDAPTYLPVTVVLAPVAGTATAGTDYVDETSSVDIAPGDTVGYGHLSVIGDIDPEPNETFSVVVQSATDATAGAAGTVLIVDDDSGHPQLARARVFRW